MTKRKVLERVGEISVYDLDTSLKSAFQTLQDWYSRYPNAQLDYGQHDRYSESYSFLVNVERPETDEEYAERRSKEQAQRQNQMAQLEKQAKALGFDLVKKENK